jgi:hypothetical protein
MMTTCCSGPEIERPKRMAMVAPSAIEAIISAKMVFLMVSMGPVKSDNSARETIYQSRGS